MVDRGAHVSSDHAGTVQHYDEDDGYGFVSTDFEDADGDLFFHISEVPRETVSVGDRFEYSVYETDEGYQACLIRILEERAQSVAERRGHRSSDGPRECDGKIAFFDDDGGYGFITGVSDVDEDVFVHISDADTGHLSEGDEVRFDLIEGDEGPKAVRLTVESRAGGGGSTASSGSSSDTISSKRRKQLERMTGNADRPDDVKRRMVTSSNQSSDDDDDEDDNMNKLLKGDL